MVLQDHNIYLFSIKQKQRHEKRWSHVRPYAVRVARTCLLLCEGDVGVHQTPSDAAENKNHRNLVPHQWNQKQGSFFFFT